MSKRGAWWLGAVVLAWAAGQTQAGPLLEHLWGHKHCPPPVYPRSNFWAPNVWRYSVWKHRPPYYAYPSERYHIPPSYIILSYPCPPVPPAQFYGDLLGERAARAWHVEVNPRAPVTGKDGQKPPPADRGAAAGKEGEPVR